MLEPFHTAHHANANTTISFPHSSKLAPLIAAADVEGQFKASSWGKKLARTNKRAATSDFGRFKVMCLRKERSAIINGELAKLKK